MELSEMLIEAKENGWISEAELKFLYNENAQMASFYMLPRIHKCVVNPQVDLCYQAMTVL